MRGQAALWVSECMMKVAALAAGMSPVKSPLMCNLCLSCLPWTLNV